MKFEKNGKKYIKIGDKAVEYDKIDDNGNPIITPNIIKKKKNGKDHVIIQIPTKRIRIKTK